VNFAARAAGAGVAHGPEVFFEAGNGNDAIFWRTDVHPQVQGLFVDTQDFSGRDFRTAEYGEVESFDRDIEPIWRGHQFPSVGDGVLLEIIAEGKVSQHFKNV